MSQSTSWCFKCGGPNGNCGPRAVCERCLKGKFTNVLDARSRVVALAGTYPLPASKPPTEYLPPTPCQRPL